MTTATTAGTATAACWRERAAQQRAACLSQLQLAVSSALRVQLPYQQRITMLLPLMPPLLSVQWFIVFRSVFQYFFSPTPPSPTQSEKVRPSMPSAPGRWLWRASFPVPLSQTL